MAVDILQGIIGGIAATIVWFFAGSVVYMNPFVAKLYKKYEDDPGVKNRKDMKTFLLNTFVFSVLIQCLLFAFVYQFIKPVLPGEVVLNTLYFGVILVAVKIMPRFFDMWVQSRYPVALLSIEVINGAIGSFVIALVFAVML
jgi:magnesium-transporting ATPase (P-type)